MATSSSSVSAHISIQLYAFLFLVLGGGIGAVLGQVVGATTDGAASDLTVVPRTSDTPKAFNWLFFEIGIAAGLISCAVLLAASFRVGPSTD